MNPFEQSIPKKSQEIKNVPEVTDKNFEKKISEVNISELNRAKESELLEKELASQENIENSSVPSPDADTAINEVMERITKEINNENDL